jgi:hypothetical protein
VGSRFHVLRSRTRFRRYRGRPVPFSCLRTRTRFRRYRRRQDPFLGFALSDSFSAVPRASCPVSCFALTDIFSSVPRASGPVFNFCFPRPVFGGTEGVGSSFHVLRPQTHFQRYRGRHVSFFMFCTPGHSFGCTEGVRSRFHVLRSRTHFRRNRRRRFQFSCFSPHDPFSAVPTASSPVFMICAPGPVFIDTDDVRSRFRRYRWRRGPIFMFCPSGPVFDGIDGIGSSFHVLRSRTRFRRYRGCRVPFSCIALPDSYSAGPRASGPVYMFCAPDPVFDSIDGFGSRFHVLR